MDAYHVVLYVHILSLLIGISAGVVATICLLKLRRAETLADAAPWGQLTGQIEKAFPVSIVGLYATGAYMTSQYWTWSTSWIVIPIVGLAVLSLQGPLVAGRRGHAVKQALMANGPGPLGSEARRMTRDRALWIADLTNETLVLAVIWVMVRKVRLGERHRRARDRLRGRHHYRLRPYPRPGSRAGDRHRAEHLERV